jgi:hypothetical protein
MLQELKEPPVQTVGLVMIRAILLNLPSTPKVAISHFGNFHKNTFRKWPIFVAQNQPLHAPQSTIDSPQIHHDLPSKKHHFSHHPLKKNPQNHTKHIPKNFPN